MDDGRGNIIIDIDPTYPAFKKENLGNWGKIGKQKIGKIGIFTKNWYEKLEK